MSAKSKRFPSANRIREIARARMKDDDTRTVSPLQAAINNLPGVEVDSDSDANADEVETRGHQDFSVPNPDAPELNWGSFQRAVTDSVLIVCTADDTDEGEEMKLLCDTLGLRAVDFYFIPKHKKISPANFVGEGTLEKLRERMRGVGASALVVDAPLTPVQVRNMEDTLKLPVLDRQGVIIEIFRHHAKSSLAKLQVELAQLKYLQPRLAGIWMGLSRQRGGKGGLGGRGLGESRLELDRRVIKNRISVLTKKLKEAEKTFRVQSARRSRLPRVALVGYTNAGKSTLMRKLTRTEVETEDKLFSTLDTTVRPLMPPTEPKILVSDTVGFVRNLPHDLVASFKSTLQEALESQVVLHVLDVSHPMWREQFITTEEVLEEIGAGELKKVLVLNKIDCFERTFRIRFSEVKRFLRSYPQYETQVAVSALTGEGVHELRQTLIDVCGAKAPAWEAVKE